MWRLSVFCFYFYAQIYIPILNILTKIDNRDTSVLASQLSKADLHFQDRIFQEQQRALATAERQNNAGLLSMALVLDGNRD